MLSWTTQVEGLRINGSRRESRVIRSGTVWPKLIERKFIYAYLEIL